MIADPRWFKTIAFNPDECVHQDFVGMLLTSISCSVMSLSLEDGKKFIANSVIKIEESGKVAFSMPAGVLVPMGSAGHRFNIPIRMTANTKVHIETPKGIGIENPVCVVLGGTFTKEK